MTAAALPSLQASMLDRIVATVPSDPRIEALLGAGSLVTGGFDEQSDLDLVVVVRSEDHAALMRERHAFAQGFGSLLAAFSGEHVGEPRLLICLYGPPLLHVDFKFVDASDLGSFSERPTLLWARDSGTWQHRIADVHVKTGARDAQWFEDRAWVWLHYCATKLKRGELFEAMGGNDFFRDVVLGPMLRRNAGERPRGLRRIDEMPGARERLLPTLATYDRAAIAAALRRSLALYVELRAADPPPRPVTQMPQALLDFIGE